ncbi:MAG: hypothetical protein FJ104_03325 [Deltaproteobacteria bacterium]|nr:hypothetical protein [Deltaproteobacteria bacterium]
MTGRHGSGGAASARLRAAASALALLLWAAGCSDDKASPSTFTREELRDPETCKECHADHYREWSGSMHAYAAEDPVFRAMNAKGQEATDGALGDFCVSCHAPLAVKEGLTRDGLDLDSVPKALHGVTCTFCHQVEAVEGTHNNPLRLAGNTTMRGGISDPVRSRAHDSAYSGLHSGDDLESSLLCGTCHDIVVPRAVTGAAEDVHLERTLLEWQESLFSNPDSPTPAACGASCHMRTAARDVPIARAPGVPARPERRSHMFPGVDVALTEFPERDAQRDAVVAFLGQAISVKVCVEVDVAIVTLENVGSGHDFPSGATQDRRFWVELQAFDANGNTLAQSGMLPPSGRITDDPKAWLFRDRLFGVDGAETHDFWRVATIERGAIRRPVTADRSDLRHFESFAERRYPPFGALPFRVTVRLRMQPIGRDVLDELVDEGYLEAVHAEAMPIFTVGGTGPDGEGPTVEWLRSGGKNCASNDDAR